MRDYIKLLIPGSILRILRPVYHGMCAKLANIYWNRPSLKLVIIGVTGTAGKSSTVNILAHILNNSGSKTGFITTTNFSYGNISELNKHGLSMPNEWLLQRQLARMVKEKCKYAIIECTSEGLAQNRHLGINFDTALFTNLSPAHLDTHGSFHNYKTAKGKLFRALENSSKKKGVEKMIGVNIDDINANYYLDFKADKYFGVSMKEHADKLGRMTIFTVGEVSTETTSKFKLQDTYFAVSTPGEFSVYNAMMAIATANMLGVSLEQASTALKTFKGVPGRMEEIQNDRGLKIIVDYACEPSHFENVLPAVREQTTGKLIHVFGTTGGHRDVSKRYIFGELSAKYADVSIITNDDVYDSDPQEIANNSFEGYNRQLDKRSGGRVEIVLDRREAIAHALSLAKSGDTVLFTGKGSEQFLVLPGNKRVDWDEREVVRHELQVESNK